jgi:hypothetical protein
MSQKAGGDSGAPCLTSARSPSRAARSGRLVGELSVLIKRRHPEVQAEIDRVYQEHLATLAKRRRDPAAQDD